LGSYGCPCRGECNWLLNQPLIYDVCSIAGVACTRHVYSVEQAARVHWYMILQLKQQLSKTGTFGSVAGCCTKILRSTNWSFIHGTFHTAARTCLIVRRNEICWNLCTRQQHRHCTERLSLRIAPGHQIMLRYLMYRERCCLVLRRILQGAEKAGCLIFSQLQLSAQYLQLQP